MPCGRKLEPDDAAFIERLIRKERELRAPAVAEFITHRLLDVVIGEPENHMRLKNGVAPADWPGWERCAPPLGPGCSCVLIGLVGSQAKRMIEKGEAFDLTKGVPAGAGPDEAWTGNSWWAKLFGKSS